MIKLCFFATALLTKGGSAVQLFGAQKNGVAPHNSNPIDDRQSHQAFLRSICDENDAGPRRTLQATRHISSDIFCQLLEGSITEDNIELALETGGNFNLSDTDECERADHLYVHIQASGHGDYANCTAYRKRAEIAIAKKDDSVTIQCLSHMQTMGIMFTTQEEQAYNTAIRRTGQRNRMLMQRV